MAVVNPLSKITTCLTIVSMAALGLCVDVKILTKVGGRVTASVALSLLFLLSMSTYLAMLFE